MADNNQGFTTDNLDDQPQDTGDLGEKGGQSSQDDSGMTDESQKGGQSSGMDDTGTSGFTTTDEELRDDI
jgi:hypothetical protein